MEDLEAYLTLGSESVGLESCPSCSGEAVIAYPSQAECPLFIITEPGSRSNVRSKGPGTNALAGPALNHPT